MKLMKNPLLHAVLIGLVSAFYAVIFIFTAGHLEFVRLLNHGATLNSPFWNGCTAFLRQGGMRYVGYAYLVLSAVILFFSLIRRRDYDEYQSSVLQKGFSAAGAAMVLLFPLALLLVLTDRNYAIEVLMVLVVIHWSTVLLADLAYVLYCFFGQFGRSRSTK